MMNRIQRQRSGLAVAACLLSGVAAWAQPPSPPAELKPVEKNAIERVQAAKKPEPAVVAPAAQPAKPVNPPKPAPSAKPKTRAKPAAETQLGPEFERFRQPIEAAADDTSLRKKMVERHNAAVELLDLRIQEYRTGIRDVSVVFEAARLTADAKVALAADEEARRQVLADTLAVATAFEARLEAQLKAGFGAPADLARAKYARLSLEVEVLQAQP